VSERRVTSPGNRVADGNSHVDVTVQRTGEGTVYRAEPRSTVVNESTTFERSTPVMAPTPAAPARDKIRWGPIFAGLMTTIVSMLVLSVLGLAIGLSAFEVTSDGSDVGTAAAIWTALSALISFFLGGWVAGKTASVHGDDNALLNGLMVGATALALILWLTSTGLGNLLGGLGTNIADIARVGQDQVQSGQATGAADQARQTAVNAYDEARNSAWGTLAGLVLALGAAAVGGVVGHKSRHDHTRGGKDTAYVQ